MDTRMRFRHLFACTPVIAVAIGAAVLYGWGSASSARARVGSSATDWVEAAIELGSKGAVVPYPLMWPGGDRVVAHLYTPFLRVAMAASHAASEGQTLTRSGVPLSLLEPVVYVRFLRLETPESQEAADAGAPLLFGLVPSHQVSPEPHPIEPLWVRNAASVPLLGDQHSATGANTTDVFHPIIAAFAIEVVRPGYDFVAYRQWRGADGLKRVGQVRARITQDDVRGWVLTS